MESSALAAPVTAILKPGFTALSNGLIDSGLLSQLKPTELTLFLVLCRFSTGFLRLRAIIGEAKLVELTGASPSTLYEAKKGLAQRGLISISHTRAGRCSYTIARHLQPVLAEGETPEPVPKPAWARPSREPVFLPSREPEPIKSSKKFIDHQHAPVSPFDSQNDDDLSQTSQEQTGEPEVAPVPRPGLLVTQLQQMGVNEMMAHRLAKKAPHGVIENALARVKTIQTTNPAGYLVSEISRGGYQAKPDPTKVIRQVHQEIHEKRQLERHLEQQHHQAAQNQAEELWKAFQGMAPDHQAQLAEQVRRQAQEEGFASIPGWGDNHPAFRGLLLEAVSQAALSLSSG